MDNLLNNLVLQQLHDKIAKVCPIISLCLKNINDRNTWTVLFDYKATQEQKDAAYSIMNVFDVNAPIVPVQVTNYQGRQALINSGMFATIDSLVNSSTDNSLKNAWNYASNFIRNSPFIESLKGAANLNDAQIDQLFVDAGKI